MLVENSETEKERPILVFEERCREPFNKKNAKGHFLGTFQDQKIDERILTAY